MAPTVVVDEGPILELSPSDQAILKMWFKYVDTDRDGRVTAKEAGAFFLRSELSPELLKGVWTAADASRRGFLDLGDFGIAMKLIGQLQQGQAHQMGSRESSSNSGVWGCSIDAEESMLPYMRGIQEALEGKETVPDTTENVSRSQSGGWGFFSSKPKDQELAVTSIVDGLKELYNTKLKPLETQYKFHDICSPELRDSDFDAKPMVLLLGQYSTGKTTFIKSILGKGYPGSHIGPEPTTDRFTVIMHGVDERTTPGHTAAVQKDMPFRGLTKFGGAFLEKFEVAQMPHPLLKYFSFVDSPGVLSGEKQRTMRSYDFTGVTQWLATKSDLILLLFDPHKLDISDEFKRVISSLSGNSEKIRVVLNKADQVDTQQLMRVYGALMWSLGKVLNTPEVVRVYIGSFSGEPLPDVPEFGQSTASPAAEEAEVTEGEDKEQANTSPVAKQIRKAIIRAQGSGGGAQGQARALDYRYLLSVQLCKKEQDDLLSDLGDLPRKGADRKVNEFVKRARNARVNAFVISHLRMQMPMFGRPQAQAKLLENLEFELLKVQREHHLPQGDMPAVGQLKEALSTYSFDTFEKLKPKLVEDVDQVLEKDIPDLLSKFRNPYA